VMTTN